MNHGVPAVRRRRAAARGRKIPSGARRYVTERIVCRREQDRGGPAGHSRVEEVTLTRSGLTGEHEARVGLFDNPRRDRDHRIVETERRLRDRPGGTNALYRVVEVAPWHPAQEMRALQLPVDPSARNTRRTTPPAGPGGDQRGRGARAGLRASQGVPAARGADRRPAGRSWVGALFFSAVLRMSAGRLGFSKPSVGSMVGVFRH